MRRNSFYWEIEWNERKVGFSQPPPSAKAKRQAHKALGTDSARTNRNISSEHLDKRLMNRCACVGRTLFSPRRARCVKSVEIFLLDFWHKKRLLAERSDWLLRRCCCHCTVPADYFVFSRAESQPPMTPRGAARSSSRSRLRGGRGGRHRAAGRAGW